MFLKNFQLCNFDETFLKEDKYLRFFTGFKSNKINILIKHLEGSDKPGKRKIRIHVQTIYKWQIKMRNPSQYTL